MNARKRFKEPRKLPPKTLPEPIEVVSLKALLGAYGSLIASDVRWLYGFSFSPEEWAEYPMLARALQQSTKPVIVNFPSIAQTEKPVATAA